MDSACGLVNPAAFCRRTRRIPEALAVGRVDPCHPALTSHPG
jgi:hypothetical protein